MKRVLLATAALVAAVAVFTLISLPPGRTVLDASWNDGSVPGLLHIHTNRSDGQGTPDAIAAAASRAGLKFLVFTDHGDATREPDPVTYRSGVLCLDGVEISTTGGHYVAIDLGASPYPLAGEPRDVAEDVHRLGGFGMAAHPDSPKAELRWSDWDVPFDGLELINPDTSWRVHVLDRGWRSKLKLLEAIFAYPVRASETIGGLLTDSLELEERWNRLTAGRRVVGLAGVDAHARLELTGGDPRDGRYALEIPGYEASFRTLSVRIRPARPFSGDARADAAALIEAVRNGRLYTAVDAWASPPAFEFIATNGRGSARAGEVLPVGGPLSLQVRSNAPSGFLTTVWKGSQALVSKEERDFTVSEDEGAAVYRVEIRDPRRAAGPAWIISNPIYVRGAAQDEAPSRRPSGGAPSAPSASNGISLFDGRTTAGWTRESDATSVAAIDAVQMVDALELRLRFGLSGGSAIGQFSGAAVETAHGVGSYAGVAFTIRAEHPMRISVQLRAEVQGALPERWQRSVFVDTTDSSHIVSFEDMRPVGTTHTARAVPGNVRAIMFIVDTTNSKPGASGRIWLKNVRLER